ncbi:MAG: P-type conjugative transfer protein VirB9 [Rhodanobacteraceae bacterium]|jgi:type IV secretion system protein VirB9|nr:MAG: P-type conjugative transfer protein VirB9 [Rhodanobacteraceae bacterium]
MRAFFLTLLMLLLLMPTFVSAETIPKGGPYDARIKTVIYNPSDVVKIVGHYGYSTDIEFAADEHVQSIALGDSLAWEVAPAGSHLFVKPREDNAVTNATVVTNKRVYQLSLDARHVTGLTGARSKGMFFEVRFRYPEDAAALAQAQRAQADQARLVAKLDAAPKPVNWDYYACGERSLWPSEVFDDGRFTYLRFPNAQEIPAIFIINADGTESLVNGEMRHDEYVVQTTARKLVLRRGKSVACMQNRHYNPRGSATPTDTVSPDVQRTLRAQASRGNINATPPVVVPTAQATGVGAISAPVEPGAAPPSRTSTQPAPRMQRADPDQGSSP